MTERLVLDAGALIALERNDRRMWATLSEAADASIEVVVPVGALAQIWRGTAGQARLSQALKQTRAGSFDAVARSAGELCGDARTSDPIDASIVLSAVGTSSIIATSDPSDIRHLIAALDVSVASAIAILRV